MKKHILAFMSIAATAAFAVSCGKTETPSTTPSTAATSAEAPSPTTEVVATTSAEPTISADAAVTFPATQQFFNEYNAYVSSENAALEEPIVITMPETTNPENKYVLGDNMQLTISESDGKISELTLTLDIPASASDDAALDRNSDFFNFGQTQANIIYVSQMPFLSQDEAGMFKESMLALDGISSFVLNDIGYSINMSGPTYEFIMQNPATTISPITEEAGLSEENAASPSDGAAITSEEA